MEIGEPMGACTALVGSLVFARVTDQKCTHWGPKQRTEPVGGCWWGTQTSRIDPLVLRA